MKYHGKFLINTLIMTAAFMAVSATATAAETDPAAVVSRFNQAITDRNLDTALAQFADGSVQFQLRPAHPGMDSNPPLTTDLLQNWQAVGAVLFSATESYVRSSEILSVEEHGDIATIWTNTKTETRTKDSTEPLQMEFSELYLLVKKNGAWKIAANVDNRQAK